MSRHAKVAFAAATALLAGGSILYSCTTAKVETATPESKRAINTAQEIGIDDRLRLSEQEKADLIEYLKSI
ncbi:MAG: hypothetical protein E6H54_14370 [Betaproteobacteria bacterium]|nr:MAG: hypothetical protein E6H54_14370 [Betaproteobacteria bacterium]